MFYANFTWIETKIIRVEGSTLTNYHHGLISNNLFIWLKIDLPLLGIKVPLIDTLDWLLFNNNLF